MAGVYAGGDIVTGAATVIQAMGAGRKAARSMKAYLGSATTRRSVYEAGTRLALRHRAESTDFARVKRALTTATEHGTSMQAQSSDRPSRQRSGRTSAAKRAVALAEHIVEVISDSGEGAQRCGQALGAIAARMGNGIWTVEIIPAEIQPPARSVAGASGIRIRMGSQARHQRRRRDRPRRRVQRAGAARSCAGRRAQARLHDPAREHVARAPRSGIVGVLREDA